MPHSCASLSLFLFVCSSKHQLCVSLWQAAELTPAFTCQLHLRAALPSSHYATGQWNDLEKARRTLHRDCAYLHQSCCSEVRYDFVYIRVLILSAVLCRVYLVIDFCQTLQQASTLIWMIHMPEQLSELEDEKLLLSFDGSECRYQDLLCTDAATSIWIHPLNISCVLIEQIR